MKIKILHKSELVHPIFIMLFIGGFSGLLNYSVLEFWKTDLDKLLPAIIIVTASYLILSILNTLQVVAIHNNQIVKGLYCAPFGFLKIKDRINISDIKGITLTQQETLFYDIIAESKDSDDLLITSIANKIPAEKELNLIKTEINKTTYN